MATIICVLATLLCLLISSGHALNNGLALTPPMGFMSWAQFRCNVNCTIDPNNCISQQLYTEMADHLVSDGYQAVGYEYVVMDDCWMATERDASGKLQPDPDRFPDGISYLADYMHTRGLKLGIYEDVGTHTCGGYPGCFGHYEVDAQTFADWGVDYLKLDGCYTIATALEQDLLIPKIDGTPISNLIKYVDMGQYLNATGRPIVYSCSWPAYLAPSGIDPNYTAIAISCNLWRNWYDIEDDWSSIHNIIEFYGFDQVELVPHAGPGHWNDPDMLIIGETGITFDQSQAQMAMWSVLAAPMLISSDLRTIDPNLRNILLNTDAITISQDPLGIMGRRIYQVGGKEVWTRPVTPTSADSELYSYGVVFLNNELTVQVFSASLEQLGMTYSGGYQVKDIFAGTDYGLLLPTDTIEISVNPTGVAFFKAMLNAS